MLYLAQVHKNDFLDQHQLRLLARQEADNLWAIIPEEAFILLGKVKIMSENLLVLVELSPTGDIERLEDAANWVLHLVQSYLTIGITPEFLQHEAERAEHWRQSLTLQNQDLARRSLELEARREQIQALEESLKRDKNGVTVWFTGLSGAGKTTICEFVEKQLRIHGYKVEVLDGDAVRQNLCKGLGFSKEDRQENIRRIGFVAHLLARNNVIVLVSAISPYREIREQVRQSIPSFIEVYVNASLEVCEQRDVKGLYKKARSGEIKHFIGIDDPYEIPLRPEVECKTNQESVAESATKVLEKLKELGYIVARVNNL